MIPRTTCEAHSYFIGQEIAGCCLVVQGESLLSRGGVSLVNSRLPGPCTHSTCLGLAAAKWPFARYVLVESCLDLSFLSALFSGVRILSYSPLLFQIMEAECNRTYTILIKQHHGQPATRACICMLRRIHARPDRLAGSPNWPGDRPGSVQSSLCH